MSMPGRLRRQAELCLHQRNINFAHLNQAALRSAAHQLTAPSLPATWRTCALDGRRKHRPTGPFFGPSTVSPPSPPAPLFEPQPFAFLGRLLPSPLPSLAICFLLVDFDLRLGDRGRLTA